mmetsp:Transcript_19819/g.22484  ORF Transcript_19819/g.22484 Transcript_19819/m.22484 type:complete len:295 (-) Transcript_19819:65-949(-)
MILQTIKDATDKVNLFKTTSTTLLPSSSSSSSSSILPSLALFVGTITLHTIYEKLNVNHVLATIYDQLIVHMTSIWYKNVLERLEDGSTLLDVGIGTAGALLQCKDIIKSKNIKVIGIDYNPYYIQSAQETISKHSMSDYIKVHCTSVYDSKQLEQIIGCGDSDTKNSMIDAVYFSGSFSLLPNPKQALISILPLLKTSTHTSTSESKGRVYITQTYQKRIPPFMTMVKPWIKYVTTIDFGKLVTIKEIKDLLMDDELKHNGLNLVEHDVMKDSLDNYWQAAYLSILEVQVGSQ